MAWSRAKKEEIVARYEAGFAQASHAILVDYQGVGVPDVTELRNRIRDSGARYEVVKNRLALRAIEGKPLGELSDSFDGPVAIAYSDDDIVGLAKVLTEFAEERPTFTFRGGLLDGQPVAVEQIEAIASLPTRDELIAKLVYLLKSPISRLVRTLAAMPRDLVLVLNQIGEKKAAEPAASAGGSESGDEAEATGSEETEASAENSVVVPASESSESSESTEAADVAESTESADPVASAEADETSEATESDEPAESEESAET